MDESQIVAKGMGTRIRIPPPPDQYYLGPKLLPYGGKILFGGEAKIGKSFILLEIARVLATGGKLFGHPELISQQGPIPILFIEQELGESGLYDRAVKMYSGLDLDLLDRNMKYVSRESVISLSTDKGRGIIRRLLDESGARVLMLDPISKFHTFDENEASGASRLIGELDKLRDLYRDRNLAICYSHHSKKPNSDKRAQEDRLDPYSFRGSSKFFDDQDCILTIIKYKREYQNLNGRKAWKLHVRWNVRHGDMVLPEMILSVNDVDDCRVRYVKDFESKEDGEEKSSSSGKKHGLRNLRDKGGEDRGLGLPF